MDRVIGDISVSELRHNIDATTKYISTISLNIGEVEDQVSKILGIDGGVEINDSNKQQLVGNIKGLMYVAQGLIANYGKAPEDIDDWKKWWHSKRIWIIDGGEKVEKSCFEIALEGGIGDVAIFQNRTMG